LLFLDLDHFKRVNDTLGHQAGDLLLRDVATTLAGRLRAGDLIARIGGDEFVVLMDDLLSLADAEGLARRLISVFETPFRIMDQDCHIGVSIGISHYPQDADDFETLLSRADMAMYHAKQSGRQTFRWFEPAMAEEARACMRIEVALQDALQRNELSLEYQPIVRLSDGTLSAVLVHSCWRDPELGEIPASRFMRRADEAGLGSLLGSWMLARACREIAGWDTAGVAVPRVSVKLSTRWLDREQTLDELRAILRQARITAERLDIEIDESALRGPSGSLVANLNALSALGVTLTVGEFGFGLAALSDLRHLPVRRVKLQESLLSDLMADVPDERMANALIGLARALDLRILVEGVASAAQAEALRRMGYDEVLGPWSGCPSPAASWPSGAAVVLPPDDQP
jgi:diguanylate cyclase (GGDEF)-like protein